MHSTNLQTNFDNEIDDDLDVKYHSAKVESNNKLPLPEGTVRNRKTKFGSFQSVLKFKRNIEIDTTLESETDCNFDLK